MGYRIGVYQIEEAVKELSAILDRLGNAASIEDETQFAKVMITWADKDALSAFVNISSKLQEYGVTLSDETHRGLAKLFARIVAVVSVFEADGGKSLREFTYFNDKNRALLLAIVEETEKALKPSNWKPSDQQSTRMGEHFSRLKERLGGQSSYANMTLWLIEALGAEETNGLDEIDAEILKNLRAMTTKKATATVKRAFAKWRDKKHSELIEKQASEAVLRGHPSVIAIGQELGAKMQEAFAKQFDEMMASFDHDQTGDQEERKVTYLRSPSGFLISERFEFTQEQNEFEAFCDEFDKLLMRPKNGKD